MIVDFIDPKEDKLYSRLYEQGLMIVEQSNGCELLDKFEALDSASRAAGDHKDYPNEIAKSRGNYQSALGAVVAKELSEALGWHIAWIRSEKETVDDNVLSVIDSERRFVIFPILLARRAQSAKIAPCVSVYEKIKRGDLPDVPPGSFHEIKP
jgi:hypothetical protein